MKHPTLGFNQTHHLDQNIREELKPRIDFDSGTSLGCVVDDRGSTLGISELLLRALGYVISVRYISVMVNNDCNPTTTRENKWPLKNIKIS